MNNVNVDDFKQAMGCFPSGVTIVTTINSEGNRCGFTASAFSSLSLDPPMILVCLANNADCFDPFAKGKQFAVNIIGREHEDLAFKFASKGVDKFSGEEFETGETGLPILPSSVVSLECETKHAYPGGDHVILVGLVEHVSINGGSPSIWHGGKFNYITN